MSTAPRGPGSGGTPPEHRCVLRLTRRPQAAPSASHRPGSLCDAGWPSRWPPAKTRTALCARVVQTCGRTVLRRAVSARGGGGFPHPARRLLQRGRATGQGDGLTSRRKIGQYMHMHTHACMHACMHAYTCVYTPAHAYNRPRPHACEHARAHAAKTHTHRQIAPLH